MTYYTVFNADGEVIESGIIDRSSAESIIDYHGNGAYAEDAAGNRLLFDCRNCGAGDVQEGQDCPECLGCNM